MIGDGFFTSEMLEWVQDVEVWLAIYYHHENALTIKNQTYAVGIGDIAFIPPAARAAHGKVGGGALFDFVSYNLPALEGPQCAIPHVVRDMSRIFPDFRRASERIVETRSPAQAFVWNLMWSVAQSTAVFRGLEELYVAEAHIRANLDRKLTVSEVAEVAGVSQRHLLRCFRQEHQITVQEFILRMRTQEAMRLLLNTQLPIKEIAHRVGFHDLQHFNKTMRSATGAAPTRYRELSR
jgi:AraC-like DNA-binding protein